MKKIIFTFVILVISSLAISQNIDSGLVAYFPFNGNANDESGNGNNGTVIGATLTTDRYNRPNKAYFFNNPLRGFTQGNTNLINCGHGSSLQLTNAISISLWCNANITGVLGSYLIGKAHYTLNSYEYLICFEGWKNYAGLKSAIGGLNYDEAGTTFMPSINTWYHITVSWEYPGKYKIFCNGVLLKNQPTSGGLIEPTEQDLVIGCIRPSGEPSIRYFYGKIDDIRIYNRVLTIGEITSLYNEIPTNITIVNTEIPEKYTMFQNYPNPFNPTTSIKYHVASIKHIKLIVYNMLGKEVATLVNEKQKPGTYEVKFDGNVLNSGVYFYKLSTDNFTETKKMLLVK